MPRAKKTEETKTTVAPATIDKNAKILVIVESLNKKDTLSKIFKKLGFTHTTVMASVGHIMTLGNGGSYYNSGISPEKDFEMNLEVSDDKHKVVDQLKAAVKTADLVYLMSDPDREGEVISWSLIQFLKIPKTKIRRAITHEITPKAVVNAIKESTAMYNE